MYVENYIFNYYIGQEMWSRAFQTGKPSTFLKKNLITYFIVNGFQGNSLRELDTLIKHNSYITETFKQ